MRLRSLALLVGLVFLASPAAASPWKVIADMPGGGGPSTPHSGFAVGAGGVLYGVAPLGGSAGRGVVYRLTPPAIGSTNWTMSVLHTFVGGSSDGSVPYGRPWYDAATGALYGTTSAGGKWSLGTVWRLTPPAGSGPWTSTVLHHFRGSSDGALPIAGVTLGTGGVIYGTTNSGGAAGLGTVYQLSPPTPDRPVWSQKILKSFRGPPDGSQPNGAVVLDGYGFIYGTTTSGGTDRRGTVWRLVPKTSSGVTTWSMSTLYSFKATGNDGLMPMSELVRGVGGRLYGTTSNGGAGYGTVFELTPGSTATAPWTEKMLHIFKRNGDGSHPVGGVYRDSATGTLYGSTATTFYKITPSGSSWVYSVIYTFDTAIDGLVSYSTPVKGRYGYFFGTTLAGGAKGVGTAFQVSQ